MTATIVAAVLVLVTVAVLAKAVLLVVPQSHVAVVERLGRFDRLVQAGVHCRIPFYEQANRVVDLREQRLDVTAPAALTEDGRRVQADIAVTYRVTDSYAATYEIADVAQGLAKLTEVTWHNLVAGLDTDTLLWGDDQVTATLRSVLVEAAARWGTQVEHVELRRIRRVRAAQVGGIEAGSEQ